MASVLGPDKLRRSFSRRGSVRSHSSSIREVWSAPSDVFRQSVTENDEEDLKWAALEKLPTYDRMRKGILKQAMENGGIIHDEVDLSKLGDQDRKTLLDSILKTVEQDNERFLSKHRERVDRVGIDIPKIEVRFEHLSIEADARIGSRALPTLLNSVMDAIEGILELIRLSASKKRVLKILRDVSGIVKPSRMTLLLGPPSSGKTTLLLALAGKLDDKLRVTGKVTYCGHELSEFVPQRTCAYISQHDLHNGEMTVRETMDFSGRCLGVGTRYEMLSELSRREKQAGIKPDPEIDAFMKATAVEGQETSLVTDYNLKLLGLDICADVLVGDEMRRGISGGQKKRVTTGEMLVGPAKALFMDEISTGLDSSTTFQIVKFMRQMVHVMDGTMIISLLQPAPETFDLFDDVILLSEGQIVYQGPRESILEFFEFMGFKCPERKGVADFLQEVTSKKDQEQYWFDKSRPYQYISVSEFSESFNSFHLGKKLEEDLRTPYDKAKTHPAALAKEKYGISSWELFKACFSREWLLMKRNSFIYIFKTFQITFMSLITLTVFFRTEMDHKTIADGGKYFGVLVYGLINVMFNGMTEMAMTVQRLPVFYKQRDFLFYPPWAFGLPIFVLRIPVSFVESAIWVLLTYYTVGFAPAAGRFFRQFLAFFFTHQMALSLFRFIGALGRTMVVANSFGMFVLLAVFVLGGFVISKDDIKPWWIWGYWSSPMSYGQIAITVNEFLDKRWSSPNNDTKIGEATIGKAILKSRGVFVNGYWYWISIAALIGFAILFNSLFIAALTYLNPLGSSQAVVLDEDEDEDSKKKSKSVEMVSSASNEDEWWMNFGIDDLELQNLAIRILSQTCSSSGCERNWSVFERIHTKRRNRLEYKRLNDLVYTHYNLRLKERQSSRKSLTDPISLENIDLIDDWVVEAEDDDAPLLDIDEIDDWMDVADAILDEGKGGAAAGKHLAEGIGSEINGSGRSIAESAQRRGMVLPFQPLSLAFNHVNYSVDMPAEMKTQGFEESRLQLLHDVSGAFRPGILTALVGVSGAGKTTLMDVLAGRKTGGYIEGSISISGYPKNQETFARVSGYCEQNDIHSPNVTVYESLVYSAWLRLSPEVKAEKRMMFVEQVMELIELTQLRNALVGLPGVDGLSTEQRKRLTIAVELVANPSIIFMDEPTSGLDARAAAIVMRTVRNTVDTGRTVVCTIHQPSIDIFESFDELLLMKRGGWVIYAGPLGRHSHKLVEYFEAVPGVPKIKDGYNPATWMLEVSSASVEAQHGVDFADIYANSTLYQRNQELIKELSTPPPDSKDLYFPTKYSQGFTMQCIACFWKQYKSYWRNPPYNSIRMLLSISVALLFGTIFWNTGEKRGTQQDLLNMLGAMYATVLFLGALNASAVQPVVGIERTVFYRERAAGMYSAFPYAIAQVSIEAIYVAVQTVVYCLLVFAMIGFTWEAKKFFLFLYFMYMGFVYFTLYGMMLVALTPSHQFAAVIMSFFFGLWNLFSGFLIFRPLIPIWWRWYYWGSPVAWTIYGLVVSQAGEDNGTVVVPGGTNTTVTAFLKDSMGFKYDFLGTIAGVHVGIVLVFVSVFAYSIKQFNFQQR